jgi:hypothetical protein
VRFAEGPDLGLRPLGPSGRRVLFAEGLLQAPSEVHEARLGTGGPCLLGAAPDPGLLDLSAQCLECERVRPFSGLAVPTEAVELLADRGQLLVERIAAPGGVQGFLPGPVALGDEPVALGRSIAFGRATRRLLLVLPRLKSIALGSEIVGQPGLRLEVVAELCDLPLEFAPSFLGTFPVGLELGDPPAPVLALLAQRVPFRRVIPALGLAAVPLPAELGLEDADLGLPLAPPAVGRVGQGPGLGQLPGEAVALRAEVLRERLAGGQDGVVPGDPAVTLPGESFGLGPDLVVLGAERAQLGVERLRMPGRVLGLPPGQVVRAGEQVSLALGLA